MITLVWLKECCFNYVCCEDGSECSLNTLDNDEEHLRSSSIGCSSVVTAVEGFMAALVSTERRLHLLRFLPSASVESVAALAPMGSTHRPSTSRRTFHSIHGDVYNTVNDHHFAITSLTSMEQHAGSPSAESLDQTLSLCSRVTRSDRFAPRKPSSDESEYRS